jgi:hypothetical protein
LRKFPASVCRCPVRNQRRGSKAVGVFDVEAESIYNESTSNPKFLERRLVAKERQQCRFLNTFVRPAVSSLKPSFSGRKQPSALNALAETSNSSSRSSLHTRTLDPAALRCHAALPPEVAAAVAAASINGLTVRRLAQHRSTSTFRRGFFP